MTQNSKQSDTETEQISKVDFSAVTRTPFYFGEEKKQLFGWLHINESVPASDTGVVICPSLGVEYMNAYRPLRYVADYHALAGIPALRFDYHGTGDSSGLNEMPGRIEDWVSSIEQAVNQLKMSTGCKKILLIGFRFGAALAVLLSEKIEFEGLVLWAPIENGKRYIREIRTLQRMAAIQVDSGEDEFLEAGGAVFDEETVDEIEKVNLIKAQPKIKRALIVPRDDLPSTRKLNDAWLEQGISSEQVLFPGFSNMVIDAHYVLVPHNSIREIVNWVKKESVPGTNKHETSSFYENAGDFTLIEHFNACCGEGSEDAQLIKESIAQYGPDRSRMAVLSEPLSETDNNLPVIIMANSGSNHHVGPNRLYVLLARELARKGFRSLRIDIAGLGDSVKQDSEEENIVYSENSSDEIRLAMKLFEEGGKKKRYIVMGLCSGSYFSFHAVSEINDCNICEAILINPLTFYWEEGMSLEASPAQNYSQWNWYKNAVKNPKSWLKLIKGRIAFRELIVAIYNRIKIRFTYMAQVQDKKIINSLLKPESDLGFDLLEIISRERRLTLFLSRSDPGYDILITGSGGVAKKLIKQGKVKIHFIENADHTFSKNVPRCDLINQLTVYLKDEYL